MDLFQRIQPNTTILTPNRRLSAAINKRYAQWQIEQGKSCWSTLDSLPLYPSWLERLWRNYTAGHLNTTLRLLTTRHEQILWEKILRDAPETQSLLQISETAKLAKAAFEILKRWQIPLEHDTLKFTEDSRAFLQWSKQFVALCDKNSWLDLNSLADKINGLIHENKISPPSHIILTGFTEIAPQYQTLLKTCEEQGTLVEHYTPPDRNQTTYVTSFPDVDIEIQTMARWAKAQLSQAKSIGCIIPNLESQREKIIRIFKDVFGDTSFNISAGKNLTNYPIIHDALLILKIQPDHLPLTQLTQILRSPFVAAAEKERNKRALYAHRLQNANINHLNLSRILEEDHRYTLIKSVPSLSHRFKKFLTIIRSHKETMYISAWVNVFNDMLTTLGWPGERSLNSQEYQVVQNCWLPLLNEFSTYDFILGKQTYSQALHYLHCLANGTVFQPESPEANVHVLGLLEAAEIPFEASWIMGLDDTSWPARAKPNPFIPLRLQKTLQLPNASAERELLYCQQLTKQLQQSAKDVIFSHAEHLEDAELRPSSLLIDFPRLDATTLIVDSSPSWPTVIFDAKNVESFQDTTAPSITDLEKIHGGVRIFKSQADCPFKAFAEIRLHAKKTEETTLGLRKLDRGIILHKALELIWLELKDSQSLHAHSDESLKEHIHKHAQTALQLTHPSIDTLTNTRYLQLELNRLEKIVWQWLQVEKERPPFAISVLEKEITIPVGPVVANFRIDRVDQLLDEETGSDQLIIDYKTGKDFNKSDWFSARINEPQLPIYCIAHPEVAAAIAFAKIHPDTMELVGVSKFPLKINTISLLSDYKNADATLWDEQVRVWHTHLTELGTEFYAGKADVAPRDANQTCRLCGLHAFCRIHELSSDDNHAES